MGIENTEVLDRLATLSVHARKLLKSSAIEAEPPIRSELFGLHRFEEHGRSLALAQVVETEAESHRRPSFFPRVEENLAALRDDFDYVALTSLSGHYTTPAAEWLLDNFPLIEAQLQQIREGVPRRYYASLPKLAAAPLQGLPRVYGIAWAYVAHTDSVLNPEIFTAFLNAYQSCSELRLSELWAVPTTLRVVLLENLRRMADGIAQGKLAREIAHSVWDSAGQLNNADLDAVYELISQRGLQRSYLTQLWQRMPTEPVNNSPPLVRWCELHCPDGHALMLESQIAQVASNLTVGNIITTLRLIGQVDWVELIEPVSRSLRVLRRLPSFCEESELTRQQITQAMERLARRSLKSERQVAEIVVAAALSAPDNPNSAGVERSAGFYLVGAGRARIESALGLPPGRASRLQRWRNWRLPAYIAFIVMGAALILSPP